MYQNHNEPLINANLRSGYKIVVRRRGNNTEYLERPDDEHFWIAVKVCVVALILLAGAYLYFNGYQNVASRIGMLENRLDVKNDKQAALPRYKLDVYEYAELKRQKLAEKREKSRF
jgi:hypothetical protein